ncbi:hypothetical protein B0O80DRAFT_449711 [Mortierella sp. GBAus27b]|nr:hypothetical protein B0O80DRAFT_449711 [Mortierella sp. GBAus27b]
MSNALFTHLLPSFNSNQDQDYQTQQQRLQEEDMSIISSQADHQHASSASTNPFRRSPPVSPQQSNFTTSTQLVDFQGEDPFSISAVPQRVDPFNPTSHPTATVEVPSNAQVGGPSSAALASAIDSALAQTVTAPSLATPSGSTPAQPATSKQPEPADEYVLKPIDWIDPATSIEKRIKIITQNENGPCPLLALCNTLILQGKIAITPYDRPVISYDHLLELLADYLLNEDFTDPTSSSSTTQRTGKQVESEKVKSRLEIESALRLLPHLQHGLDVNVYFKSIRGFEPTAELSLFHTFGVELVHGWVVDPEMDSAMHDLVGGPAGITSYNKAVECIVSGDEAGGGLVVEGLQSDMAAIQLANRPSGSVKISAQDEALQNEKVTHALIVQEFMNITKTQLTPFGLHVLRESLPEGHLCAFFRNNHFCTLFRNPMDSNLYTLVTDQSLAHEESIVWESLVSVDGAGDFLDGLFRHGALEVGDYARNNQSHDSQGGDEDFALALQLQQQEEEEEARRLQRAGSRGSNSHVGNNRSTNPFHLDHQPYETDEEMAARLHQEYLLEQQQQEHQQQLAHQHSSSRTYPVPESFDPYSDFGTRSSQPPPGATQTQQHQQQLTWQQQPQQPLQQQQGHTQERPRPHHPAQSSHAPKQGGHSRARNSSDSSSSRKSKGGCIIQ